MSQTQLLLVQALQKANSAVNFDNKGDYLTAAKLYEETIVLLESESCYQGVTGEREKEKLTYLITAYTDRLDGLSRALAESLPSPTVSDWNFVEVQWDDHDAELESPPTSAAARPYWVMRLLMETMINGGFITDRLYIPRDLWFQSGAKFVAIEAKFNSCDTLLIWLQKLKELDITDLPSLSKDVEEFCLQLNVIQNNLARKLQYVDEVKNNGPESGSTPGSNFMSSLSKQVERIAANYTRDKVLDSSSYINLLFKIFDVSQFLDVWYPHLSSLPATPTVTSLVSNLNRINEFMYNVFLAFVFQDLRMLLKRYVKKNRADFV